MLKRAGPGLDVRRHRGALFVSENTVKTHVSSLYGKLAPPVAARRSRWRAAEPGVNALPGPPDSGEPCRTAATQDVAMSDMTAGIPGLQRVADHWGLVVGSASSPSDWACCSRLAGAHPGGLRRHLRDPAARVRHRADRHRHRLGPHRRLDPRAERAVRRGRRDRRPGSACVTRCRRCWSSACCWARGCWCAAWST